MQPPRICPPGKIVNPATNRCVLIHGQIGKQILRRQAMEAGISAPRGPACPPGKIYNIETGRCVNVRGVPGRRILRQIETVLDARNPVLQLLPPEHVLEIWGLAHERPRNCGALVKDFKQLNLPLPRTMLQQSVVKTLEKMQRILKLGHYTKNARIDHQNEKMSIMDRTSVLLHNAKRRNATVDQLINYCRQIGEVKKTVSDMVDQLQRSLRLAEEYLRTGELPPNFTGKVILNPYDLPRIRRLRQSAPMDVFIIRRLIRSFKRKLAKDETVRAMLAKPIDIRN